MRFEKHFSAIIGLAILALPVLGTPIHDAANQGRISKRDHTSSNKVDYLTDLHQLQLEKRAPPPLRPLPPPGGIYVDMGQQKVGAAGSVLYTKGLQTCTGMIVTGPTSNSPKILAHINPGTIPTQQTAIHQLIAQTFAHGTHFTVTLIQPKPNSPGDDVATITRMNKDMKTWAVKLGGSVVAYPRDRSKNQNLRDSQGELEVDKENSIFLNAVDKPII